MGGERGDQKDSEEEVSFSNCNCGVYSFHHVCNCGVYFTMFASRPFMGESTWTGNGRLLGLRFSTQLSHQNPGFIWTQMESTIAGYNMHVYNCIIYENIVYLESRFLTMTMIVGNQFMVFPWFSLSCTPGLPAGLHIGVLTSSDQ